MPATIDIKLKGLIEAQADAVLIINGLHGEPILRAMRGALMLVQGTAIREAKVDRGWYRASITPEIDVVSATRVEGSVGTNIEYGPFAVLDTRPHWPPVQVILEWVRRKKLAGAYSIKTRRRLGGKSRQAQEDARVTFLVRRKISRVGTKGDESLMKGIDQNRDRITKLFTDAVVKTLKGKKGP